MFEIVEGTPQERARIESLVPHLDLVSESSRTLIVTAWLSVWKSSGYAGSDPSDFPYTLLVPDYRLMNHVREVTEVGVMLADYREREWGEVSDPEVLVPTLILHDVDKPLLYERDADGTVRPSRIAAEVPHGVLGGFLLKELGFSDTVVSIVTTHAANSPFHSKEPEAWVLHYADFFSADHAITTSPESRATPFYQRHWEK